VHDNFVIGSGDGEIGALVVVLAVDPSNSRSTDVTTDTDSIDLVVCRNKDWG
jgi:hypothetical protein